MHCPNCGTQASADQKFCRSCGIGLQMISQALAEELAAVESNQPPGELVETARSRYKKFARWGAITALSGVGMLVLMSISLIVSVPLQKTFELDPEFYFENILPWLFAVAITLIFTGIGLMIAGVIKKHSHRQPLQPSTLPQADTTSKLPPASYPEPAPSVAERTTDLLEPADPQTEKHRPRALES